MAELRVRKVTLEQKDLLDPSVQHSLSKIVDRLRSDSTVGAAVSSALSVSELSNLLFNVRSSLENLCGKDSARPRPVTKFPANSFQDYSEDGFVSIVVKTLCQEASKKKTAISQLFAGDSKSQAKILVLLEQELLKAGKLERPKVFLNKVPVGMLNKLSRIVTDHGGVVVSSEDGATHVIDWNEDVDGSPDNTDDFIRILEVRGTSESAQAANDSKSAGSALVHWWYYPDSYNEWIPDSEFNSSDAPDLASLHPPTRSKWYVCCRYILDCDIFNEWGNPADYEIENEAPPGTEDFEGGAMEEVGSSRAAGGGSSKKARGKKRFSQLSGAGSQDRGVSARDVPVLGALAGLEKLMPDAVPPSVRPDQPSTVLELAATGGSTKVVNVGSKRKAEDSQLDEPVSPSASTDPVWFSSSSVSEFEEQALGATCTADPVDYLKIRNGVLALCAQSPLQYITGTECRRKLPGDVSKILQIHEFLNAFALINSRARRDARTDAPVSVLASAITSTTSQVRVKSEAAVGDWSPEEDAALLAAVQAHRSVAVSGEVDWQAVAHSVAAGRKTPAECAARFVGMDLSSEQIEKDRAGAVAPQASAEALLAAVRQFTEGGNGGHGSEQRHAASVVAADAIRSRLKDTTDSLAALSASYLQVKLAVLEDKTALLRGVEALFDVERERLDAEKKDLQILRAQLALVQQSFAPDAAAAGAPLA